MLLDTVFWILLLVSLLIGLYNWYRIAEITDIVNHNNLVIAEHIDKLNKAVGIEK